MSRIAAKIKAWISTKLAADSTPVSAELGAEAVAIGDGTSTAAELQLSLRDVGAVTLVRGSAKATAEASGAGAYADAGTFGTADGVDLVINLTRRIGGEGGDAALSGSSTRFFALDLPFDFAGGPKVIELQSEFEAGRWLLNRPDVEGSRAVAAAEAEASGPATQAEAYTDSIALVGYADSSAYAHAIVG